MNMDYISLIFYARVCVTNFIQCGDFDILNVIRSADDLKTNYILDQSVVRHLVVTFAFNNRVGYRIPPKNLPQA